MKKVQYSLFDRMRIPDYDTPRGINSGDLIFDGDKCRECGICISICPGGCLITDTVTKMDILSGKASGGKYGIPRVTKTKRGATLCVACFDCGAVCPHGAISIRTHLDPNFYYKRLTQTDTMTMPRQY